MNTYSIVLAIVIIPDSRAVVSIRNSEMFTSDLSTKLNFLKRKSDDQKLGFLLGRMSGGSDKSLY